MLSARLIAERPELLPHANPTVAGLIWIGFGLILLTIAGLFLLEGVLYLLHQPVITLYVRAFRTAFPLAVEFAFLALLVGMAAAFVHFVLDGGR